METFNNLMKIMNPEDITNNTFDEMVGEYNCPINAFCIPLSFVQQVAENPSEKIQIYFSKGGNICAARVVRGIDQWNNPFSRVEFICNPEENNVEN